MSGKQFRILIRHPQCYSYIHSSESLGSDKGKKKSSLKVKDPLSLDRYGQTDMIRSLNNENTILFLN